MLFTLIHFKHFKIMLFISLNFVKILCITNMGMCKSLENSNFLLPSLHSLVWKNDQKDPKPIFMTLFIVQMRNEEIITRYHFPKPFLSVYALT